MNNRVLKVMYLVLEMDLGGLQRLVNLLIERIDRKRFHPYLCCLDRGGMFYGETKLHVADSWILHRKPGPFDRSLFWSLYNLLKQSKIDVIHSHSGCMSYAALAGRLAGVRGIVHTDHGRLVPDRRTAIIEDRLSSLFVNQVVGVSEALTQYLAAKVRVPRKKLVTVINGVDTLRFCPKDHGERRAIRQELGLGEDDRVLGTVCRLDPVKNLPFLIRSIPVISEKVPNCKLVIVGDGPDRNNLVSEVKGLRLENRVLLLGRKPTIERLLSSFDMYVCTSLSEGTSMTILEAMACGLPIVASAVGGNVRLIDETNGLLFPVNNTDQFVTNVVYLFENPSILERMGVASRHRAETQFDLPRTIKAYEEMYQSFYS